LGCCPWGAALRFCLFLAEASAGKPAPVVAALEDLAASAALGVAATAVAAAGTAWAWLAVAPACCCLGRGAVAAGVACVACRCRVSSKARCISAAKGIPAVCLGTCQD
jgi:hypothetical protein